MPTFGCRDTQSHGRLYEETYHTSGPRCLLLARFARNTIYHFRLYMSPAATPEDRAAS